MKKHILKLALLGACALTLLLPATKVQAAERIRPTDISESTEYANLGLRGVFVRKDAEAALTYINNMRREACENGYPDPRNTSRSLTEADYHALVWSNGLEWIAQTRAAEASIYADHTRPNGSGWYTCTYQGVESYAECLAWSGYLYQGNFDNAELMDGVQMWESEKKLYLKTKVYDGSTGHYASLIDPNYQSIALGCFVNDATLSEEYYIPSYAAEFSPYTDQVSSKGCSGSYTQAVPVERSSIKVSLKVPALLEKGQKGKATVTLTAPIPEEEDMTYTWSQLGNSSLKLASSNKKVVTVDRQGNLTTVGEGSASITASMGKSSSKANLKVLQRPKIIAAYNGTKGIGVKFYKSTVAEKYRIYRCFHGKWVEIATVPKDSSLFQRSGNTLMYIDKSVKNNYGKGYIYSVAAVTGGMSTSYDRKGAAIFRLKPPTLTSTKVNGTTVKVTWNRMNVNGYELQYSIKGTNQWVKCPHTSALSQTVSGLKRGKTYVFRIRSYKTNKDRGTFYSTYSTYKSAKIK